MPIYAYKCESCGFAKDVLQKISDAPLQDCPECRAPAFKKQVTAAGFQLKGSGWYVTDFKGGSAPAAAPASGGAGAEPATSGADKGAATETASAPKADTGTAAPAAASGSAAAPASTTTP